jgi:hypothetical protein
MTKWLLLVFACFTLSAAGAETFRVTLFQSSLGKGTQLNAGNYRMDLNNGQLIIRNGKQKLQVPVAVENADQTFHSTRVLYTQENGKYSIREIQLGGTRTRVLLNVSGQAAGGR